MSLTSKSFILELRLALSVIGCSFTIVMTVVSWRQSNAYRQSLKSLSSWLYVLC